MAKVDLNKLEDYYDESPAQVEKIKRKNKPSNPNKKHVKTDSKRDHKKWEEIDNPDE